MRELLINGLAKLACKMINPQRVICRVAKASGVDLLPLAYQQRGILKYENERVSGEENLWRILERSFGATTNQTIIDCGANVGDVTVALRRQFPHARLIALEPNPVAHKALVDKTRELNVEAYALGLSDNPATTDLHLNLKDASSEHASLYSEVSLELHKRNDLTAARVSLVKLDDFAAENGIDHVIFLKIDTEGHELAALRGAAGLLSREAIDVVQFEFNEMNVISRVFLRDFYKLIPQYAFFRLDEGRLISLGEYSTRNEIFQFHNIVAFNAGTLRRMQDLGLVQ